MGQVDIVYLKDEEIQAMTREPLWWQKQGLQYTASGYGKKIPTEWVVTVGGRKSRVYMIQKGNAGSSYILKGKQMVFLHDWQFEEKAKEPWQMTREEWFDHKWGQFSKKVQKAIVAGEQNFVGIDAIREQTNGEHLRAIQRAILEGKPIIVAPRGLSPLGDRGIGANLIPG
jgi:hypothetical protein